MGNLMGTDYILSILLLIYKFREINFYGINNN